MRKRKDSGQLFLDNCQGLTEERQRSRVTRYKFNQVSPEDEENRELLKKKSLEKKPTFLLKALFILLMELILTLGITVISIIIATLSMMVRLQSGTQSCLVLM